MPKKNTFVKGPSIPYQRQSDAKEAAKFLSTVTRRFVNDGACANEVDAAILEWRKATYAVEK